MTSYPYNFDGNTVGWYMFGVAMAILSLLIASWAIDSHGAKAWNHREPLPHGVYQITRYAYLLDVGKTNLVANDICRGTDSSDSSPVYASIAVKSLKDTVYVQCSKGQTWNDHRSRSINFGHAIGRVVSSRLYIGLNLLLFLVLSIWPLSVVLRVHRGRKLERQKALERKKANKSAYEKQKSALAAAWARDEINDKQFEIKLDELVHRYEQG